VVNSALLKISPGDTPISVKLDSTDPEYKEHFRRQNWIVQKFDWDLLWSDHEPHISVYQGLKTWQKINSFPEISALVSSESLLAGSLKRMKSMFPQDYKIFPKTWIYPKDQAKIKAFLEKIVPK
jgi:hypothetical protein